MNNRYYGMQPKVYLECKGELSPMKKHQFEKIEQDELGRDVVTFVCAECNQLHKSRVFTS